MSVNTMGIEQAYALITELHKEATGRQAIQPVDLTSFISVANSTLQAGYDTVLNAISQVITRTLVAVRPYERKFAGLEYGNDKWGAITRKISFADRDPLADPSYALVDGTSEDQYTVRKPDVLETRYVGSLVYTGQLTIFREQLNVAFSSPQEFANFMSGLMVHFSNEREQWLEELSRATLANFIGAKKVANNGVIHLLTEYNTETGLSLTATTVRQPANFNAFCKWMNARVETISKMMTERSQLYQLTITGKNIFRHTPVADQKVYINADFLSHMTSQVLADTYHDNYLKLADTEAVNYWQNIQSPYDVQVKPVYINSSGAVVSASANQTINNVIGVMFDRDAIGYNIYQDTLETSPYNAKGQYYNLFAHVRAQYQNDLTEKGVLLLLD